MVTSLRETVALAGMDEAEVRALLGEPDYADSPELLAYIIDMPFDASALDIYLQDGIVTEVDTTPEH